MVSVGPPPEGKFLTRLEQPAPHVSPLDYATREGRFSRPQSLAECLLIAASDSEAQSFVAGNTDLGVVTNLRGERYSHLISLDGIPRAVGISG